MKKLILLPIVFLSAICCAQQCADTCQFKTYYMHNADSSKYSSVEFSQQGLLILTEDKVNGTTTKFQIDSYNATGSFMESYYPGGQNIINSDKNNGISILGNKVTISGQTNIDLGGSAYFKLSNVAGKLIIKTSGLPTTCTGQTSGTLANIGGFLKVCP